MPDIANILKALLQGEEIGNAEFVELKTAIKPVFYDTKGFMKWRWSGVREQTKKDVAYRGELLLGKDYDSLDDLVVEFSAYANELYQGRQGAMYYDNDHHFPDWPAQRLSGEPVDLKLIVQEALEAGGRPRERAIMLISQFAENSSAQSRKSIAGNVAQDAVELVLRSIGLKKGTGYETQFRWRGSDTDFVVPFAARGDAASVRAFIAVQNSTNDRARLSSSELHRGAARYLVSLNGCPASPKTTSDIGDQLIAKYIEDENLYVVIESERKRALADARDRLERAEAARGADVEDSRLRLRWLNEFSINFDEFAERLRKIDIPDLVVTGQRKLL